MSLTATCVSTNIVVVRDGMTLVPGTGYCTGTAGDRFAYTKETAIISGSSDDCLQYFEGVNNLGTRYRGWNIVVDNGRVMYSVGSTMDGTARFFDRLEQH